MLNAAASSRNDAGRYVVNAPAKSPKYMAIRARSARFESEETGGGVGYRVSRGEAQI